jgi:hypothetical protein
MFGLVRLAWEEIQDELAVLAIQASATPPGTGFVTTGAVVLPIFQLEATPWPVLNSPRSVIAPAKTGHATTAKAVKIVKSFLIVTKFLRKL